MTDIGMAPENRLRMGANVEALRRLTESEPVLEDVVPINTESYPGGDHSFRDHTEKLETHVVDYLTAALSEAESANAAISEPTSQAIRDDT